MSRAGPVLPLSSRPFSGCLISVPGIASLASAAICLVFLGSVSSAGSTFDTRRSANEIAQSFNDIRQSSQDTERGPKAVANQSREAATPNSLEPPLRLTEFLPLKEAVLRPWRPDPVPPVGAHDLDSAPHLPARATQPHLVSAPRGLLAPINAQADTGSGSDGQQQNFRAPRSDQGLGSNEVFGETTLYAQIPPARNTTDAWYIYKTQWSAADEAGYEAFVTLIGRSACDSLDDCLRDPANPYRDLDDNTIFLGDCADMAYFLRGYYAWKNGLPFSYQHRVITRSGEVEDLRYSTQGNIITDRRSVLNSQTQVTNAKEFLGRIRGEVSTAMFRTHPVTGTRNTFDDFYPVEITRSAIRSGSIAYDVYGHVGLTYDLHDDGTIPIFASHPDFRITRSRYGSNFIRTGPEFGGGLKAWRPIRLVMARKTSHGHYIGGRIEGVANADIHDFSIEQYNGTEPNPTGQWLLSEFRLDGRTLDYYDFVRRRLAAPGYSFNPLVEMRIALEHICSELQDRRGAIRLATRSKFYLKPHPGKLPPNIYGTYGDWELYSTPSRDARLKQSYIDLMIFVQDQITRHRNGAQDIAYEGDNLAQALLDVYDNYKNQCRVRYQRSDESYVILNFGHVIERVFDLSFDPYHCPELRWGAQLGLERSSCIATPDKFAWYEAQRYLRYQVERSYDIRMDFTLAQLRPPNEATALEGGLGVIAPPDVDVRRLLDREARNFAPDTLARKTPAGQDHPLAASRVSTGVIIEQFEKAPAEIGRISATPQNTDARLSLPYDREDHRPDVKYITYYPIFALPDFSKTDAVSQ